MMTLFGWLAGNTIVQLIEDYDHWLALILLAWIGTRMIITGIRNGESDCYDEDPSRGMVLIGLCIATSIDALAAGLSMAVMNTNLYLACITIAVVSTVFSLIGLLLGHALGKRFGKTMEIVGGFILIAIGLRVVVSHMFL
jgi:putative Mn2+ efflux pump MntP